MGRTAAFGLFVVVGCADSRTPTSDMTARLEVRIEPSAIDLTLMLREPQDTPDMPFPGSQPYVLEADERVRVKYRDRVEELQLHEYRPLHPYTGTIAISEAVGADEQITLVFERGSTSVEIAGTAPPPLTASVPPTVVDSEGVTVTWSPTAKDQMFWFSELDGVDVCCHNGPIREDVGTLVIPAGIIASSELQSNKLATVVIVRERVTTVESALSYSDITVSQEHAVMFTVVP